jgi:hypothetical protein
MPDKIEPITAAPAADETTERVASVSRVAVVSSALEVLGVVLVLVGMFALSVWAGVVLLGVLAVVAGYYLGGAE